MTIFGLREVDDRTQAVDPSNVSGNISVLLDVQYNDETVTNVDLTLGDEVISCRGASSDASPVGVAPTGLAESGGSVELECFFDTDQVAGECMGMQLEPRFANGEHELGAQITTADGTVREALATQMITLKNANYVMIDHNPGKSMVVAGVPYYGGPTTEENVNTFDVCPVAFDGTVVGSIRLRGMTDTKMADGTAGTSLSFRAHRAGSTYGEYWGAARTDDEAPFTFTAHSDWNGRNGLSSSFGNDGGVEDINPARDNSGGHWIIQDGAILDPDGVDISAKFVPGDAENNLTKIGPIYFDFNAPRVTDESQVTVEGESIEEVYYSGMRGTTDPKSQRIGISNVSEGGSGGRWGSTSQVVAVGDCSISANSDTGERGAGTAFEALVEDANTIGDLPEDDPYSDDLSDDGVQCYTAELQSIADPLGNARSLSKVRIRSANNFGVDKTPPEIDNLLPDEELVLMEGAVLTFEVEDPELATGENGSGIDADSTWAYWGPSSSWAQRYFFSEQDGAPEDVVSDVDVSGVVTISTNTGDEEADKERRYVVVAAVHDNAVPPHRTTAVFTYTRDSEAPTVSLSKSQADIGSIGTATVMVGVGGTIADKNVIKTAELSIRNITADGATCSDAENEMTQGRTGRVVRNKRDLENDTNEIVFDESFTIRRPTGEGAGPETYCFWLATADIAVGANGRGTGNMPEDGGYELGTFDVDWPSTPVTPPGPTFEFQTADDNANPTTFTDADSISVAEGTAASAGMGYWVRLANVETAPTATAPVTVTVTAPAGLTVTPTTLSFTAADSALVTVEATHDLNLTSELLMVNHTATDYEAATFPVRVEDDDFSISASVASVREDADSTLVIITATAATAPTDAAGATVNVTAAGSSSDVTNTDFRVTPTGGNTDITIPMGMTSATDTVYVTALDDGAMDEDGEAIQFSDTGKATVNGPYAVPASIMIVDADPDISVSLSHTSLDEGSGATVVTVTAELDAAPNEILTFTIGDISACAAVTTSVSGPSFMIDAASLSGSGTVTVTPEADINDGNVDCPVPVTVAPATKRGGSVSWTLQSAEVTIVNANDSSS